MTGRWGGRILVAASLFIMLFIACVIAPLVGTGVLPFAAVLR